MKKIMIKKMKIENFKGIGTIEINFTKDNAITGRNGVGKSTIYNAYIWCLTGLDKDTRKNFFVKNLNSNENFCSVEILFNIDGGDVSFKRVYTDIYETDYNNIQRVKAHETSFSVNKINCSEKEYNFEISRIFGDNDIIQLLSNVNYWQYLTTTAERRDIISKIVEMPDLGNLKKEIETNNKKVKELKKQLSNIDLFLKEKQNYVLSENEISNIKNEISNIEKKLENLQQNSSMQDKINLQNKKNIELKLLELINTARLMLSNDLLEIDNTINQITKKIVLLDNDIDRLNNNLQSNLVERDKLINEFNKIATEKLTDNNLCPFLNKECNEYSKYIVDNFEKEKENRINKIKSAGQELKKSRELIETQIDELRKNKENLLKELAGAETNKKELPDVDTVLSNNKEYNNLKQELDKINKIDINIYKGVDVVNDMLALNDKKNQLLNKLNINNTYINDINKYQNEREAVVKDLLTTEKDIEDLKINIKKQYENLENTLNDMFDICKFKLFTTQLNGEIKDDCQLYINNIPYESVNTASKIIVGLDIIDTFSKAKELNMPVWVDNRESILYLPKAIENNYQIINISVSDNDLTIINK
jgi:chromosome segregation ATPase